MSETTPPSVVPTTSVLLDNERLWATLVHLGAMFFHFLPAMFGYLLLKVRGPFIREHTRAALNFQLTVLLANIIGLFTIWFLVGFLILAVVAVVNIVFSILAAVAANRGDYYRYPVAISFVAA